MVREPGSHVEVANPLQFDAEAFSATEGLRRLCVFVTFHYARPIDLEMAARVAGLEKHYFSRLFRARIGACFRDWLAYVRIRHASDLLLHQDLSVRQAAKRVGIPCVRTFERRFREFMGTTPSSFRAATQAPNRSLEVTRQQLS